MTKADRTQDLKLSDYDHVNIQQQKRGELPQTIVYTPRKLNFSLTVRCHLDAFT